ncbi:hypothetical protein [Pelagibius marinus]|uniref:hypothetical protein n=1 Tax=Pelagibius marinus TaxID=2762760 RepID=UPI001D0593D1|nr:hypothetical protein [Pelagibius marinus]
MSRALPLHVVPSQGRRPVTTLLRKIDAGLAELRRRRQRRAELRRLLRIGPHMLADVGMDSATALAESRKPLWRA